MSGCHPDLAALAAPDSIPVTVAAGGRVPRHEVVTRLHEWLPPAESRLDVAGRRSGGVRRSSAARRRSPRARAGAGTPCTRRRRAIRASPHFEGGGFLRAFLDKGLLRGVLERIP